ncbi:40S ribosomal protein S11 [Cyclospora cayetanensis]|uniref:Small ribosomal subunit protein uS17 n=2 Tax=Cyclospora cayetanensis TaxID=88456 RepID=A0A1D3D455_9EIME|nr:40S ribosomal protein S11 [Cyclospora cayetanensis]OEH78236.1 40s ribosomal protein [Cyclospora cayetanensis]
MSATQQDVQTEKAFQRQQGVSQSALAQSSRKKGKARYWREVGLGFTTPRLAKEGTYVDKKCPFTGNVSIRGRIIKGMVISTKMKRCVVIRRTYLHCVSKYSRVEKRHKNVSCHLAPCFEQVKEGDIVTAGQCRPLSKTVRFNVLKVESNQVFGNVRKQFRLF